MGLKINSQLFVCRSNKKYIQVRLNSETLSAFGMYV